MSIRTLLALPLIAALAGCTSTPEVQTGDDAEVVLDSLHRVDHVKADMVYIDPDVDFSKYNKVLITPLGVDNIEIIQPNKSTSVANQRDWELTDQDKQKLQQAYHDAMVKYLDDKGSFPIVTEAADDVLQISAALTAIAPSAARDDGKSRPIGRSKVYTEGAGSLAIFVVYGDSETGEVFALVKDRRTSSSVWGSNNSVSNMADVRRMFNSLAAQIHNGLVKVTEVE
jgi:Protein of unknown function (DUF3313)